MGNEILHGGAQAYFDPEDPSKDLTGNIGEPRTDFVRVNQELFQESKQLFICKAIIFFPIENQMIQNTYIHKTGRPFYLPGNLSVGPTWF